MRKNLTSFILIVIMLATNLFSGVSVAFAQPSLNSQNIYQINASVDETKKPEQIGLAMTTDPQTSISINWTTLDTTLTGAKVTVWEKSAGENTAKSYDASIEKRDVSKSTIPGVAQKNFYAVTVNGLKPDTEYNYCVGVSGAMSEVKSFKTAQADEKPYTFIYFGDPQTSGNNAKGWNADLDIAKSKYPDAKFLYIAGDLTNTTNDEGQWESFFNQPGNAQYNDKFSGSFISELPVAAVMGNHDGSNAGAGGISSHYTFGSQVEGVPVTYAYTYGAARFIVVNTQYNNLDSAEQAKQAEFVKKEAAAAKAAGKWAIVELHKSPYTGANHLDDGDVIGGRKYWSSVLSGIGVDAILAGHDHVLSRGFVKADGTKVDVTKKVADRVYTAQQPDNAPLYFVANTSSTLKFYAPLTNNDWIQPNDPVAPSYGFLDVDSAFPAGDPLNPLGPTTNDDLDGTAGFLRLPTFTAVTVSKDSIKFDTYMTGFDRDTDTIVKDTFLYDSLTLNRAGVSKVETESQLKRIAIKADGTTLPSDTSTSIKLSLTGKDNFENEKSISGTVQYKTDKADILSVSADGTVTLKNQPTENTTVNVWAEVTNGEKTIISDKVPIKVNGLGKLESVTIAADHTTLNRTNTAQLSITGKHSSGASVDFSKASVQYTSSNPSIVSVDDKGVVKANKVGSADITAVVTLDGTVVQSNTVTITVNELGMDAVNLGINTDKAIVGVGEEVQVKLNAKGAKNLYGFDSTFSYDPNLFELESVTVDKDFAADSSKAYIDYKDNNGKVRIVTSLTGAPQGVTGDVNIIDVKLKAKDKDVKTSFAIAKGAAVSDSNGAIFTTPEDVVSELTVANADVTGGGIAINDLVLVAKAFGTTSSSEGYNAAFDINKDGVIDIVDISYVAKLVIDGPDGDGKFTFAVIPDTQQEEVLSYAITGGYFKNRTQWLADNREALDLRYVAHTGDVVNWDTPNHDQYEIASNALKVLDDAKIPNSLSIGNHDTAAVKAGGSAADPANTRTLVRNTSTFNSYFPTTRYPGIVTFEPNKVDNSYKIFSAAGKEWMILTLELWPRTEVVEWAKQVVADHPNYNVIITTHSYLDGNDAIYNSGSYGANSPQYLFDNLVKVYPNIKMVFSGHTGIAGSRVDTGINGNKIISIRGCFHSNTTNPVQLVEVDVNNGTVSSRFYGPLTDYSWSQYTKTFDGLSFVK